jgi:hypothetical protein
VYAECASALQAIKHKLAATPDFESVLGLVNDAFHDVRGTGEMIVYDVADRIALHLGLKPTRIYLHRGTRAGAKELVPNITSNEAYIEIAKLPAALRKMSARELENALCIYKNELRRLRLAAQHKPKLARESAGWPGRARP